jgi:hypothetical protein
LLQKAFLVFLVEVSALAAGGRPKIVREMRQVNEISLKLLPPHDHSRHQHDHHQYASPTTKEPEASKEPQTMATKSTTERPVTSEKPVTNGDQGAEIVKNEFVSSPDGYNFL